MTERCESGEARFTEAEEALKIQLLESQAQLKELNSTQN